MNIFANVVLLILVLSYIALNVFNLTWCVPIQSLWDIGPSDTFHHYFTDGRLRYENRVDYHL